MNERYKLLEKRVELLEAQLNKYNKRRTFEADNEGAAILYEDSEWTVYRITTYKAAVKYGRGTSWSIAERRRDSDKIFVDTIRNHNLDGGFYFYINKNDPRKKYCVLQSKDGKIESIRDALYEPVDYLDVDLPVVPEVNLNGISDDDRLIKAVMDDDLATAKELLSSGADPNAVLRSGHPLLCVAAADLNYPMVKLLLKEGADPNVHNRVNGGAPINAVLNSMKKWNPNKVTPEKNRIIKELLNYGATVDKSTLENLCSDGNAPMVKLVINNIDLDEKSKSRLLWRAADFTTKGNVEVFEYLLDLGVDPNTPNSYGETLLQKMSKWDQRQPLVAKYISLLKKHGAEE